MNHFARIRYCLKNAGIDHGVQYHDLFLEFEIGVAGEKYDSYDWSNPFHVCRLALDEPGDVQKLLDIIATLFAPPLPGDNETHQILELIRKDKEGL